MGGSLDLARRSRRFRSPAGLVALVAALALGLIAATAHGSVAVVAFSPHGGTETATETIPGPGDGGVETDQLPRSATDATIDVEPKRASDNIKNFDDVTDVFVSNFPKLGKLSRPAQRILTCAFLSALVGQGVYNQEGDIDPHLDEHNDAAEAVFLDTCLQIALGLSAQPTQTVAQSAATRCAHAERGIAIRLSHSRAGYRAQTVGKTRKSNRHYPLAVTCRRRGKGVRLTIKPRKRGATLRQAGGPNLGIGFVNPTKSKVGVRVTFTVR